MKTKADTLERSGMDELLRKFLLNWIWVRDRGRTGGRGIIQVQKDPKLRNAFRFSLEIQLNAKESTEI